MSVIDANTNFLNKKKNTHTFPSSLKMARFENQMGENKRAKMTVMELGDGEKLVTHVILSRC
jgi:hypothetical protein